MRSLAAAGIGYLILVDFIEVSDLNLQVLYREEGIACWHRAMNQTFP